MCRIYAGTRPGEYEAVTRSLRLHGAVTSIRLEARFWAILDEMAAGRGHGRRARTLRGLLEPRPDPIADETPRGDDGLVERTFITFVNTPRGRMVEMIGSSASSLPVSSIQLVSAPAPSRSAACGPSSPVTRPPDDG